MVKNWLKYKSLTGNTAANNAKTYKASQELQYYGRPFKGTVPAGFIHTLWLTLLREIPLFQNLSSSVVVIDSEDGNNTTITPTPIQILKTRG